MMKWKEVLVLDDDRLVHLLVQQLSKKAQLPWRIRHVYFLEEALHLIDENHFDLLLSDVHLQHPSKIWHLLGALPEKNPLPVVLMSSEVTAEVRAQAFQYKRVRSLFRKPLPAEHLISIHNDFLHQTTT